MRPPNLNTDTLDLLYEWAPENLPPKERMLDCPPEEVNDRFVVIGEEVVYKDVTSGFGGCWPDLSDALESYDWNAGPPAYVVDLFAGPEVALFTVRLIPYPGTATSLRAHVG